MAVFVGTTGVDFLFHRLSEPVLRVRCVGPNDDGVSGSGRRSDLLKRDAEPFTFRPDDPAVPGLRLSVDT